MRTSGNLLLDENLRTVEMEIRDAIYELKGKLQLGSSFSKE
jgi:hypothetical protein